MRGGGRLSGLSAVVTSTVEGRVSLVATLHSVSVTSKTVSILVDVESTSGDIVKVLAGKLWGNGGGDGVEAQNGDLDGSGVVI